MIRVVLPLMAALFLVSAEGGKIAATSLPIIPRPRFERTGSGVLLVDNPRKSVVVSLKNAESGKGAIAGGIALLSKRVAALSEGRVETAGDGGGAAIVIERCSPDELSAKFAALGMKEAPGREGLLQGYLLRAKQGEGGAAPVTIAACGDLGCFYALLTLVQIIDVDKERRITVPETEIADWPAIGRRVAKTSGSEFPLESIEELRRWSSLFKINLFGVQYHGQDSKNPGRYSEHLKTICNRACEEGTIGVIAYFCPFRGKGGRGGAKESDGVYRFKNEKDREQCLAYYLWCLEQGAVGVEIDYNDWSDISVPIETVIKAIHQAVRAKFPEALVLYCPPMTGESQYRGPASEEMKRILAAVPGDVLTLWTGPATKRPVIADPLTPDDLKTWAGKTGRKPFLWVNSAFINGVFSKSVDEIPGYCVFRGDLLPKNLEDFAEGVHLNTGFRRGDVKGGHYQNDRIYPVPDRTTPQAIAYLATAADFLWNPRDWDAVESCRRAKRLTEILTPLLAPAGPSK